MLQLVRTRYRCMIVWGKASLYLTRTILPIVLSHVPFCEADPEYVRSWAMQ